MKTKLSTFLALACSLFITSAASAAPTQSEALSTCKTHISSLYGEDARHKVKKIKSRAGAVEVKFKVSAEGERFNAVCKIARNGEMTYSTDRATIAGS